MKNIIKLLVTVVVMLVVFSAAPVHAQLGVPGRMAATNLVTGTVVTNGMALTTTGLPFGGAVQVNLLGLGAGATNTCTVALQKSVDGLVWTTADTITLTGLGASTAMCISNIAASPIRNWRVFTVSSTANGAGTNLNVEVWFGKPSP